MSAAHTPGPWIIDPRHYWDKGIGIRQDADGWHRLYCEVDRDDCDRDTAEANARLIAAAPALLDVAIQLEESLTADGYESVLVRDLRAAISLATGEAK
ncbi:MAG: hypothetical protein C0491_02490 [Novosphingobium sp.]|nr:hypothetical protein [Novosphingobium sp.]